MAELPDIRVDGATEREDIEKVVSKVKPTWPLDQLQIKQIKGGCSAIMRQCFISSNPDDAITIRAANLMASDTWKELPPRSEPGLEKKVLKVVTEHGCGPRVLAFFQNGYCYEYIVGKPVLNFYQPPKSIEESTFRSIARQLAAFHLLQPEGVNCTESNYIDYVEEIIQQKYPESPPSFFSKDDALRELREFKGHVEATNCRIGLCHGDTHLGNIVNNAKTNSVTIVDWESVHVAYQALDVGQVTYILNVPEIMTTVSVELPDDYERRFVRHYLEERFRLQGKTEEELTSEEEDKFYGQVKLCQLLYSLFIVSLITALSPPPSEQESSSSPAPTVDLDQAFKDLPFTPTGMAGAFHRHYVKYKDSVVEKYVKQKRSP